MFQPSLRFQFVFLWVLYANFQIGWSQNKPVDFSIGDKIDSLNGVYVFYNLRTENVSGRNLTEDGYNLGLKYQCVEFVKRFYYQALNHKMPNTYGHAKDFFQKDLKDGHMNRDRNLVQFKNGSSIRPQVNDLVVIDASKENLFFGHVAIISKVNETQVEIIQQNPETPTSSRETLKLIKKKEKWHLEKEHLLGWLRLKD